MKQDDLTENLPAELPEDAPIDIWDRTNERSVINLLPPALASNIIEASKQRPEFFQIEDERLLRRHLRENGTEPTPTDNRLRVAFWHEYERAQTLANPKMVISAIHAGVCSRQLFDRYMLRPEKVAWILCPPASYTTIAEEALSFGLEQLRDILALPVQRLDAKGRVIVDTKLGELQAKIVAMLDNRVKGAVKQTIENRNMNLNISTSDKQVAKAAMSGTMDQIERRLKELERRDRSRVPVEVESKVVTDDSTEETAD